MRRYLLVITTLLATFSLFAENVAPYTGSRIFWDTTTRRTIFSGGYARLIELQDGRYMAVCESGGIKYAFSTNKGESWGSPEMLVLNTNNTPNCVPDLIQLRDGTIIVAYNPRPNKPYTVDRKFGIRCKRSTDNGRTWSEEIFVNDAQHTFEDGCWEPSMLELPSGELQLYFADEGPYTSSSEQQISLCRSFDGGLTWTPAQKISFRANYRDGMPVPVLLSDSATIVVALEDNGWSGVNDFLPTSVRCPLSTNWNNYWVDSNSPNREKMVDYSFSTMAKGGAPYLRVLPWGETVMSHQSATFNSGNLIMYCYVGDKDARNFKAMSTPFITSGSDKVMWNSLAVVDTGVVVAVGGVNGNIEMIKGYPIRCLHAPFGHPTVDGVIKRNEGYYQPTCTQVRLGTKTGVITFADFAYDADSLYFICRVSDRTQTTEGGSQSDAVRLLVDAEDISDTKPQAGVFSHLFRLDGKIQRWEGNSGSWKRNDESDIRLVINRASTYYIMEVAIPWKNLGQTAPPVDHRMGIGIEVQDRRSNSIVNETIPDVSVSSPYTWMTLRLGEVPEGVEPILNEQASPRVTHVTYHSFDGREVSPAWQGPVIVITHYDDGSATSEKLWKRPLY